MPEVSLSFGNVAETLPPRPPPYSAELLDLAQEALGLDASARVLDLAAGTGRLTRELDPRFADVVAVEPDERDARAARHGARGQRGGDPARGESVDAVFVGEAFHWFETAAAIGEIARVLRPRGGLAIIWTHWWETEPPLPERALELLREPYQRFAAQRNPPWDDQFDGSPFEPLRYERLEEAIVVEPDQLLELYSTTSSLAAIPPEERDAIFAAVRPLLEGPYRLPLKHELTWTRLA